MIPVGMPTPDFELPDQHGAPVRLSALRGRPVVLVFYPFAFTGVCTGELAAVRDHLAGEAQVLALSCDSMFALRVFADANQLEFPLLSDFWPHGAVASAYGVFDAERGCAQRASFVVDASGVVRWAVVNPDPEARDVFECKRVLGELRATV